VTVSGLLMDVRPLRESPAFRRLWLGSLLSGTGSQLTAFAVALQVFTLTRSSLAVGGVALATAVPGLLFGLLGGSLADAVDRRRLVLAASSGLAVVSGLLAAQAFAGMRSIWLLYGLEAMASLLSSVNGPARRTFLPRLLPADRLPAGAALTMFAMHAGLIVGPAVAGLLAAAAGVRLCYLADAVSFGAALYATYRLPAMPPLGTAARPGPRAVAESLRFVARSKVLLGAMLSDASATGLAMPLALFPAINAERFGGRPQTLGLLTTALAVGGVVGTVLSGPVGRMVRPGRGMLVAGGVWGLGIAGFGLAHRFWPALLMLAMAGIADVTSVVLRTAVIQVNTPDRHRGRVSAVEYLVGATFPYVGSFRAGAVASLTSTGVSAVTGGLAATAGSGVIALLLPAFVRYRAAQAPDGGDPSDRTDVT
jgi:MFS family permease